MNCLALFLLVTPAADGAKSAPALDPLVYPGKIKPLFAVRCLACHGALEQKGGLRVDTVADMIKGGDSGPGIIPGKPKESPVWLRSAGHG
ncbi:MAG: c-type cytochrome domain-containing protein, partial [Gemmataceae bacterium]